ncbi:hypothetical protein MIZ03_3308 [Rhodoferax lithotrophicus]|uniref:ABC transmembrane type-1 domain-containing protein n=2 Tax=Rhodoferax lithotrophicus TaxID=2798804 RepID=A0ABN6D9T8_9BURK|nr:hypothetical protein MIZ03_3308 [Rhodoferax sp. MIZ03]
MASKQEHVARRMPEHQRISRTLMSTRPVYLDDNPDANIAMSLTDSSPNWRTHLKRLPCLEVGQFVALFGVLAYLAIHGAQGMGYQWRWNKVPRYLVRVIDGELVWGPLLRGLWVTLEVASMAGVLALAVGLLVALMRYSRSVMGPALAWLYVELIRNTPILVQILIFYFIIAAVFGIPRLWAGVLCLACYEGAFVAEIIRGAVGAVRKGQWEAAQSLGLPGIRIWTDIVIPQAIPLMLPPLGGTLVNLVKHSAIVSVIAVYDLTTQARTVVSDTFLAFEIWLTTAALYLAITIPLSLIVTALERRYRARH